MAGFSEYGSFDALGLAELVRQKRVSPTELVEEAIARIDRVNPKLNAIVTRMYDQGRAVAKNEAVLKGPFAGVPFIVKDLACAIEGVRLTWGSRLFSSYVPTNDSELAARYKAAGLIILGRANTPEFGIAPVTEPELHGATSTPWRIGVLQGAFEFTVCARQVIVAHQRRCLARRWARQRRCLARRWAHPRRVPDFFHGPEP